MARPLTSCFTLLSVVAMLLIFASRECSAGKEEVVVKMGCGGRGGKCLSMEEEMEMEMDSEANRRVLWATRKRYISYDALRGDVVPCSRPGISYYNCRALPRVNTYSRGCEIITDCARDP
ncbi:protein RALF-like 33 [Typha angustifolia]|uniref:protein RALF-like 33 n=1 Tax=Typha angustifolia TaxID=59011 RepID=UPI003C2D6E1B